MTGRTCTVLKSAASAEQPGTLRVLGKSLCRSVRLPFSVSAPRLNVFQFIPCDKSPRALSDKRRNVINHHTTPVPSLSRCPSTLYLSSSLLLARVFPRLYRVVRNERLNTVILCCWEEYLELGWPGRQLLWLFAMLATHPHRCRCIRAAGCSH